MSALAINGGTPVRTKPFAAWPVFGREEEDALLRALRSGVWGSIDGTFVKELEVEFAKLQAARHAIATVNGTMALSVALKALGIGPGDEVIVPPYTFIATASAALMIGAVPVLVDVGELQPIAVAARVAAIEAGLRVADAERLERVLAEERSCAGVAGRGHERHDQAKRDEPRPAKAEAGEQLPDH